MRYKGAIVTDLAASRMTTESRDSSRLQRHAFADDGNDLMERYAQALVLLNDAITLMEAADDTLVVALLSDPRDLIAAKTGYTTVRAG